MLGRVVINRTKLLGEESGTESIGENAEGVEDGGEPKVDNTKFSFPPANGGPGHPIFLLMSRSINYLVWLAEPSWGLFDSNGRRRDDWGKRKRWWGVLGCQTQRTRRAIAFPRRRACKCILRLRTRELDPCVTY